MFTVCSLAKEYIEHGQFDKIMPLLLQNNEFFGVIPKARTAKIVRSVLDISTDQIGSKLDQIKLCRSVVAWCVEEKRSFLKQRIESKVMCVCICMKIRITHVMFMCNIYSWQICYYLKDSNLVYWRHCTLLIV